MSRPSWLSTYHDASEESQIRYLHAKLDVQARELVELREMVKADREERRRDRAEAENRRLGGSSGELMNLMNDAMRLDPSLTQLEAWGRVCRANPHLFDAYRDEFNGEEAPSFDTAGRPQLADDAYGNFVAAVEKAQAAGMSASDAFAHVTRTQPELSRAYRLAARPTRFIR